MDPIIIPPPAPQARPGSRSRAALAGLRLVPARIRHGRPGRLALRALRALALTEIAVRSGAGLAPAAGTVAGIATWFAMTASADMAPAPQDAR